MRAADADGIRRAARLAVTRPPRLGAVRLVAVDGPSGSGKTSLAGPLAAAIARELGGRVLRPTRSTDRGPADGPSPLLGAGPAGGSAAEGSSPAGELAVPGTSPAVPGRLVSTVSTDLLATWERPLGWWPVLERHLLAPLARGRAADLPVVQWVSGNPRPGGSVHVPPVDVQVLEGVSAGRRAVADRLTVLVWIEVPDRAERLERAVARDGEGMRPFLLRWQDDEDAHFAADRTRDRADVVITAP
jgi:uridine kinase